MHSDSPGTAGCRAVPDPLLRAAPGRFIYSGFGAVFDRFDFVPEGDRKGGSKKALNPAGIFFIPGDFAGAAVGLAGVDI